MSSATFDIDKLVRYARKVSRATDAGLLQAGKHIVQLASELAPVDEGLLAASGKAELTAPSQVSVSFGNGLPDDRALAQEYGTVFMPAQPYLGPAIRAIDVGLEVAKKIREIR
jgi:HK97 gp10 family phage protein